MNAQDKDRLAVLRTKYDAGLKFTPDEQAEYHDLAYAALDEVCGINQDPCADCSGPVDPDDEVHCDICCGVLHTACRVEVADGSFCVGCHGDLQESDF